MRNRLDRLWYDVRAIWWYAWIVILICAGVTAEAQTITLTDQGVYRTSVESGVPSYVVITEYDRLIDLRGDQPGPGPGPDEPDGPEDPEQPSPDVELSRTIRDWAIEVDDEPGAQALALVYRQIAEAVTEGDTHPGKAVEAVRHATDGALAAVGSATDWKPWREKVSGVITERVQQGKFSTSPQVASVFKAIAEGLISAAGDRSMSLDEAAAVNHSVFRAMGKVE